MKTCFAARGAALVLSVCWLLLESAEGQTCHWSNCKNDDGWKVCDGQYGAASYFTGDTTRSGLAWNWNFCGWAWERKYRCCTSNSPTNRPTPRPTPRPTNRPTPRPTPRPTQRPTTRAPTPRPTPRPTTSPTTPAPSTSPTQAPTFPTPFPTSRPTTLAPTQSPTIPQDLCGVSELATLKSEVALWDHDMELCGLICSLDVVREFDEVVSCMNSCLAKSGEERNQNLALTPVSWTCSYCSARWAECMVNSCGCVAGRGVDIDGVNCERCSASTCEQPLSNCTGGFQLLAYGEKAVAESDPTMMAIGAGGGVLVLLGAGMFVAYRRSRSSKSPSSRISTYLGAGSSMLKVDSANPMFDAMAGGKAGFEPEPHPGSSASASSSASSGASSGAGSGAGSGAAIMPMPVAEDLGARVSSRKSQAAVNPSGALSVLHDFTAEFDDELSCEEGQHLTVIEVVGDSNEWVLCSNDDGVEGLVPVVNLDIGDAL